MANHNDDDNPNNNNPRRPASFYSLPYDLVNVIAQELSLVDLFGLANLSPASHTAVQLQLRRRCRQMSISPLEIERMFAGTAYPTDYLERVAIMLSFCGRYIERLRVEMHHYPDARTGSNEVAIVRQLLRVYRPMYRYMLVATVPPQPIDEEGNDISHIIEHMPPPRLRFERVFESLLRDDDPVSPMVQQIVDRLLAVATANQLR